jgi:VWFA-related protein
MSCGTKIDAEAKFCPFCGASAGPLPEPVSAENTTSAYAPERSRDTTAYTPSGVAAQSREGGGNWGPQTAARRSPKPSPKKKKLPTVALIGIIAGAAAIIAATVLTIVVFDVFNLFGDDASKTPAELLSLGENSLLELDYEQAIIYFERLIDIEPKNTRGYTGLAEAFAGMGNIEEAILALEDGVIATEGARRVQKMLDELLGANAAVTEIPVEPEELAIEITQIDNSAFPKMTIFARITDRAGDTVKNLRSEHFTVKETTGGGVEYVAEIQDIHLRGETDSVSINLVLDQSGSMSGGKMEQAKQAAATLLSEIEAAGRDSVEVMSFSDYVYLRREFTSDMALAREAVYAVEPYDMTAFYDALCSAVLQTNARSGAKCVIVFTDGLENASSYTYDDAVHLAKTTGIPVYIIGIGDEIDADLLTKAAADMGGRYYYAEVDNLADILSEIYLDIYEEQKNLYQITYTSSFGEETDIYRTVLVSANRNEGYYGEVAREYIPVVNINDAFSESFKNKDYIIPDSASRLITDSDLAGLSLAELRIARNEIYARRGRRFNDPLLNQWFYSKSWYLSIPNKYSPDVFNSVVSLSTTENKNATYILQYEQTRMESSVIFPNCLSIPLTEYDVSLTKPVLQRGLSELYSMAGVTQGNVSALPDVARQNAELIQSAIDKPDVTY